MKLYLVRHAIAEDRTRDVDDFERALTAAGRKKMERAVRGLAALGLEAERVLTSPARRARETAEIVANGLGAVPIEEMPELAPAASAHAVIHALQARDRSEALVLVGHEPGIGRLASLLLVGSPTSLALHFKKGGTLALEADLSRRSPRCVLEWFLAPKQLRAIA